MASLHRLPDAAAEQQYLAVRRSHWPFFWLCAYVLSQAYTIPVITHGPWPIWITLADIASIGLVLSMLGRWSHLPVISHAATRLGHLLVWCWLGILISFALLVGMPVLLFGRTDIPFDAVVNGMLHIVRAGQFICVFLIAIRLTLTPERRQWLATLSLVSFLTVCAGIIVTYLGLIPASTFVAHLPHHELYSGPWFTYGVETDSGLGMVGYNHGYVALQVIGLAMVTLHLRGGGRRPLDAILILLMVVAAFMSGSRMGLVGAVIFAAVALLKRPVLIIPALAVCGVLMLLSPQGFSEHLLPALQRQSTIVTPQDTGGLSGRDVIWDHTLTFLRTHPVAVMIGAGIGASAGQNAHNQYLQFILESGIIGLLIFLLLIVRIQRWCYYTESGIKPVFWGTIALLVTALTQETFYPVVAFGHFLGVYAFTIAMTYQTAMTNTGEEETCACDDRPALLQS